MKDRNRDIVPGSEEEIFIEVAIATSGRMGATEKQKLSESMVEVQSNAGTKTHMSNLLNNLIIK